MVLRIILILVILSFWTQSYVVIGSTQQQAVLVTILRGAGESLQLGYEPAKVTLVLGINNTVTWKNEDTDWHTAHSNIPEFDSGLIHPGASFTHFFNRAGIYPYHCDPHPWMTGIIIVK